MGMSRSLLRTPRFEVPLSWRRSASVFALPEAPHIQCALSTFICVHAFYMGTIEVLLLLQRCSLVTISLKINCITLNYKRDDHFLFSILKIASETQCRQMHVPSSAVQTTSRILNIIPVIAETIL